MHKVLVTMAALALVGFAGVLSAQSATPEVSGDDVNKTDTHDRPLGKVKIKLPAAAGGGSGGPVLPPVVPPILPPPPEKEDVPPTEPPPDPPPPEDPPTYFDEPVEGKVAFVLDASGSMWGSRMATVRAETSSVIGDLTEDDEFDCVAYGSQFSGYTKFMWSAILPATEGNKSAAIVWINGPSLNPGGMTPSYAALQQSISTYPADLDKFFFLTDGSPNITGGAAAILADFPAWWTKMIDCDLICICIGGVGSAQTFMQQLATLVGGTYIAA